MLIILIVAYSITSVHTASRSFTVAGFDSRAYNKGSDFPAYKRDTIRIYGTRFCPYTHRLLLMLAIKNISCELVSINTKNRPEWFKGISPTGKYPCLQYNEKVACGSMITSEWLDAEFEGDFQLLPDEPYDVAKQKMLLEELEGASPTKFVYTALRLKVADMKTFGDYDTEAAKYEELLKDKYFAGPEIGWIDCMIWPVLEKIELIPLVFKTIPTSQNFPKFTSYLRRMRFRPEVKQLRRPARDHLKYALSIVNEKPNFDFGI